MDGGMDRWREGWVLHAQMDGSVPAHFIHVALINLIT